MNGILEKQLRHDMDRIRADFRQMGELVLLGLKEAVDALRESDRKKAYAVVLRDSRVDSLESTIDGHCLDFLIKHIPVAANLRFAYSAAKMGSEIERVGDYAETIARQAIELSYNRAHPTVDTIFEMSQIAFQMFDQAVNAFLNSDVEAANKTMALDRKVDEFEKKIYQTLTSENISTSAQAKQVYSLLTIANRIERVADQSCNICEEVVYMTTGEVRKHHHPKEFKVLFLCLGNSCRSQMAEAIAKKLAHGRRFQFLSAGTDPRKEMDSQMVAYMKAKGFDLASSMPKGLADVPELHSFDVLVTLCDEACASLPRIPFKTIVLNWNIEDPSAKGGEASYEKIFECLEARIRDLMNALVH